MPSKNTHANEGATRRKLIETGVRLFGLHGFEATSTRALATAADANLGSISYHFGGKEGLYRAVLEHIVEIKMAEIGPGLDRVLTVCADASASREKLLETLRVLVRTMVGVMIGGEQSQAFSQIMMQEQIAPTASFDLLYSGFFEKVQAAWAAVLGRLTGLPTDNRELRLRTLSIMGQFVIFRVGMAATLRRLDCEKLSDEIMECIVRFGIQQVEAIVDGFTPVDQPGCACGRQEDRI
ncbi:MAG: CerR family C-terminal domain-containing protein [Humidesulfovibrio sp.]|nr:CerR family C-terminal domain-containing protein [Humidesulfovibrio sp.]